MFVMLIDLHRLIRSQFLSLYFLVLAKLRKKLDLLLYL